MYRSGCSARLDVAGYYAALISAQSGANLICPERKGQQVKTSARVMTTAITGKPVVDTIDHGQNFSRQNDADYCRSESDKVATRSTIAVVRSPPLPTENATVCPPPMENDLVFRTLSMQSTAERNNFSQNKDGKMPPSRK